MILLDTHVLVWLAENSSRMGGEARSQLENEDELYLSAMTFWELSLLQGKGQITLMMPLEQLLDRVTIDEGMTVAPVTAQIAMDANALPGLHGDPVDRLLMATARALSCPLMTADGMIGRYARDGHLQAIDARQ